MGAWVHRNSAAIYESSYGPIQGQDGIRTTERAGSVYVFVMDAETTALRLKGLKQPFARAKLLATGESVALKATTEGLEVKLDKRMWSDGIPVLELSR